MKKNLLLLFIITACSIYAQAPDWEWAVNAGSADTDSGHSIDFDNNGNLLVTGYFADIGAHFGNQYFGGAEYNDNLFVSKLDNSGNFVWTIRSISGGQARANAIAVDSINNNYIIGYIWGSGVLGNIPIASNSGASLLISKLSENGAVYWAKTSGEGSSCSTNGNDITIDDDGNVYVTGSFSSSAMFDQFVLDSNGGSDIFVAKISSGGNWIWAINAGSSGNDSGNSIVSDNEGNCYLTGFFQNSMDLGQETVTSNGEEDIFVAKINSDGNWQWASKAGSVGSDEGLSISLDNSNNPYVTGYFEETAYFDTISLHSDNQQSILVSKINNTGDWLWASKAGGGYDDKGKSIVVDNVGNAYVTGSNISGGHIQIFVSKLNEIGEWQWTKNLGGNGYHAGNSLTIDSQNNTFVTGNFSQNTIFDTYTLIPWGGADIFVAKLETDFEPNFNANPTFGYLPDFTVDFSDNSAGNVINWQWDFQNDGIYDSSEQSPTFTYTEAGFYDVKLKISNATQVDSLIKQDYISVVLIPPAEPPNVQIEINDDDVSLSWTKVDSTIYGTPINIDYYLIYQSDNPNGTWTFTGATPDTTFTHYSVAGFIEKMFYRVQSFVGTRQELDSRIERYFRKPENEFIERLK
jgi:PKD repeat protein